MNPERAKCQGRDTKFAPPSRKVRSEELLKHCTEEVGNKVRKPEAVSGMAVPWPHIRNFFAQRESRDASDFATHFGRLKIDNVIQKQNMTEQMDGSPGT